MNIAPSDAAEVEVRYRATTLREWTRTAVRSLTVAAWLQPPNRAVCGSRSEENRINGREN